MIKLVNIYILCNIYFCENVRKNSNIERSKFTCDKTIDRICK